MVGFSVVCHSHGYPGGLVLRLIDSCITQLKTHGTSRTCEESEEEEKEEESSRRGSRLCLYLSIASRSLSHFPSLSHLEAQGGGRKRFVVDRNIAASGVVRCIQRRRFSNSVVKIDQMICFVS